MKKKTKISILCVFLIAVIVTAGLFIWRYTRIPTKIVYTPSADTDVNLDDPREVVGVKEYVFVGKVEDVHDYYTEKLKRTFPDIIHYYDREFTECIVTVVSNIKGELETGKTFSFYKTGGISPDRSCIVLSKNDIMPETGKYYIFTGGAHADGTMTGGGTNGTLELEAGINENNLDESKIYQEYVDAFNNQILPKNKGLYPDFLCTADKDYGDGSYNAELYSEYAKKKEENYKKHAEEQSMSYEEYVKKYHTDDYYNAVKKGNPKIK